MTSRTRRGSRRQAATRAAAAVAAVAIAEEDAVFSSRRTEEGRLLVDIDMAEIHGRFVCALCTGFFREPYTTIKCTHTFCKSCLLIAMDEGSYSCQVCDVYLGKDVSKFALPDRIMQDLIDKVLFPNVALADIQRERTFYRNRGIPLKAHFKDYDIYDEQEVDVADDDDEEEEEEDEEDEAFAAEEEDEYQDDDVDFAKPKKIPRIEHTGREVVFQMIPHSDDEDKISKRKAKKQPTSSALTYPFLKTQGSIRIGQLKKYLHQKLNDENEDNEFQILCNGVPLGNELSVTFVARTVWMKEKEELTLTYRPTPDAQSRRHKGRRWNT